MTDRPDTMPSDGHRAGSIGSVEGGVDVSTEGICSGVAGPTNAGSVERSNSVLAPDLACPDGRLPDDEASARFGAVTGGPLVSANAGDGGRPI